MKRNVWKKGPYGPWEKVTDKPVDRKAAATIAAELQVALAELKVCIVPVNIDPNTDL